MEDSRPQIPTICINDLEVIEVDNGPPRKKPIEDPARQRKRLAAQHEIRTCGCIDRDSIGARQLRLALYEFAKEQDTFLLQRSRMFDEDLMDVEVAAARLVENNEVDAPIHGDFEHAKVSESASRTPTRMSPAAVQEWIGTLVLPVKRAFDAVFPSSYYDREACLNFYRDRSQTTEPDCTEDEQIALDATDGTSAYDSDGAMSEAGSDISISDISMFSTTSISYDFKNSYQDMFHRSPAEILNIAPHKVQPRDRTLLYPALADSVERKSSPRPPQAPIQHPLQAFLSTLEYAPEEAFDKDTSGLKRAWLYKKWPVFFNVKGELQEYILHRGKPPGLSETLWLWLCGRDSRLPRYGPDQLALSIAIHSIGRRDTYGGFNTLSPGEKFIREATTDYALEFEANRAWEEMKQGHGRSLWDKMLRAEKKARDAGLFIRDELEEPERGRSAESTTDPKWRVLNSELSSKLHNSRFRLVAESVIDAFQSYSIDKVTDL
jgi:hypothetical protein